MYRKELSTIISAKAQIVQTLDNTSQTKIEYSIEETTFQEETLPQVKKPSKVLKSQVGCFKLL